MDAQETQLATYFDEPEAPIGARANRQSNKLSRTMTENNEKLIHHIKTLTDTIADYNRTQPTQHQPPQVPPSNVTASLPTTSAEVAKVKRKAYKDEVERTTGVRPTNKSMKKKQPQENVFDDCGSDVSVLEQIAQD